MSYEKLLKKDVAARCEMAHVMVSGELYDPMDPELVEARTAARMACYDYNNTSPLEMDKRKAILKELFGSCTDNIYIEPSFNVDYGRNIHFGDNVYFNYNCVILDVSTVTIGKNLFCAPGVHIYTATHPVDPVLRCAGRELGKPVKIGDNVWIGGSAVICPGVTIGDNVTIGAGSVVAKDVPSNVVVAGNPCRIIRHLDVPKKEDETKK